MFFMIKMTHDLKIHPQYMGKDLKKKLRELLSKEVRLRADRRGEARARAVEATVPQCREGRCPKAPSHTPHTHTLFPRPT